MNFRSRATLTAGIANNAISPGNPGFFPDNGNSGGSAIYGPRGEVLKTANSAHETAVTATIPIADFRQHRRLPTVHMDLYRPVFNQYVNRFPPNLFTPYQPQDTGDAYQYLQNQSIWP